MSHTMPSGREPPADAPAASTATRMTPIEASVNMPTSSAPTTRSRQNPVSPPHRSLRVRYRHAHPDDAEHDRDHQRDGHRSGGGLHQVQAGGRDAFVRDAAEQRRLGRGEDPAGRHAQLVGDGGRLGAAALRGLRGRRRAPELRAVGEITSPPEQPKQDEQDRDHQPDDDQRAERDETPGDVDAGVRGADERRRPVRPVQEVPRSDHEDGAGGQGDGERDGHEHARPAPRPRRRLIAEGAWTPDETRDRQCGAHDCEHQQGHAGAVEALRCGHRRGDDGESEQHRAEDDARTDQQPPAEAIR